MKRVVESPVLIVGAGPVGLSLALDLAWRGRACMLVERTDGSVRHSKMGSIAVRTMEFCRRWGIKEDVERAGFPEDYPLNQVFCTSLSGFLIATTHYPSMRDQVVPPVSPERYRRCPQLFFDPVLARSVARSPEVDLRYRCELSSLGQEADGVEAELRDLETGEAFKVRARYVVGCDGPGSTVRRLTGIKLEGEPVLSYSTGIYINAPGLLDQHDKPRAERYVLIGPEGNWGSLTVVDGVDQWRLTVNGNKERTEGAVHDAETWVRRAFGSDTIRFEITDVMPWRRGQLVAERYKSGSIFLAGDSAHIMAPNGGYGMNTGIADAVDLGWKLDAVLGGWAAAELLDSYDADRRPIGHRNVDAAASNFTNANPKVDDTILFDETARGEAGRRTLGHLLETATRAQWERLGVMLGHRYENSPICVPDGTPAPPDDRVDYVPTSRPGHRAPHAWLSRGHSMLDLFGRGFVLLRFGVDAPSPEPLAAAARAHGVPLTVESIDNPVIGELYERRLVLVRPDGHVAWRGDELPADPAALIDIVRGAAGAARGSGVSAAA